MKLTVGQLRVIIVEAMGSMPPKSGSIPPRSLSVPPKSSAAPAPEQRAAGIVNDTVDMASEFVDSLVAGEADKAAAAKLAELSDQAISIAKWFVSKHNPKAPALIKFAKVAKEISDSAGFWKRPSFLGRDEYVEKMKSGVKRLQNAQIAVISH